MALNYAAVLHGPYDLRVQKWPIPEINDHEVLVKMESVGICGSDVTIYSTGRCGLEELEEPIVLGHEGAGYVVKVGSKVSNLKVGDRVAIEPTQPCRACALCKAGRYNVCAKPAYCATTGHSGNLTTFYKHVADFCHKIPENLSMDEGAAVQPLAIAIHACQRAGIKLGHKLVILGAGPIGVRFDRQGYGRFQDTYHRGNLIVTFTDTVQSRLDTAKQLGVDYTLLVKADDLDEEVVKKIVSVAGLGAEPDVTIDACGFPSAQRVGMMVTRTGGTMLVVGIGPARVEVPLAGALLREVDVRGSYRISNTYPATLDAVSSGAVNLKPFITHHYPLGKAKEAVEFAKTGKAMKIIIHLQD